MALTFGTSCVPLSFGVLTNFSAMGCLTWVPTRSFERLCSLILSSWEESSVCQLLFPWHHGIPTERP